MNVKCHTVAFTAGTILRYSKKYVCILVALTLIQA